MKMKMTGRNGKDALRYAKIRLGGGDKELIQQYDMKHKKARKQSTLERY